MKRRPGIAISSAALGGEDRVLWNRVVRTVTPMSKSGRAHMNADETEAAWQDWLIENHMIDEQLTDNQATSAEPIGKPAVKVPTPRSASKPQKPPTLAPAKPTAGVAHHIERPVYRKLAKGRLSIDASIDLHHMTQDQAHHQLLQFLDQASRRGCRHVLVITGKGASMNSEGVLKRMLPIWLSGPPFSHLISGVRHASRIHGGEGAWYIRLKKAKR